MLEVYNCHNFYVVGFGLVLLFFLFLLTTVVSVQSAKKIVLYNQIYFSLPTIPAAGIVGY